MAFASIKVRTDDKEAFDRLLHEVALRSGEGVSQHELFHRILENALASKEALGPRRRRAKRSWASVAFDLPAPTDAASDLDRVVYGLDR
ncbi:MAG: hypothetical protein ACT4PT_00920 [Methanobacteriota archaeon]